MEHEGIPDLWVAIEANRTEDPVIVSDSKPLLLSPSDELTFELWSLSPVETGISGGWAFMGEEGKWVGVSSKRVTSASTDSGEELEVVVSGSEGEIVVLLFAKGVTSTAASSGSAASVVKVACTLGQSGMATARVPAMACA